MRFLYLLRAVLREIFDEAAYERYCTEKGLPHNRSSYVEFVRGRYQSPKIRCC